MDYGFDRHSPLSAKGGKLAKAHSQPVGERRHMGHGGHTGRSCLSCGATKTPQWREGPLGPKTLCNACGVKRCRQMRLLLEGKRASVPKAAPPPQRRASSDDKSDDGSEELTLCGRGRLHTARRPKRKAAAKSASRTAQLADAGDWQDDEVYEPPASSTPTSSTRILAGEDHTCNSDSAEEATWTPQPRPGKVPPFSPMLASVGLECAAAVNLLSMSIKESELDLALPLGGPAALHAVGPKQAAQRVAVALKPGGGLLRAASMPNPLPADPPRPDASAYIKQQSEKLTAAMDKVASQHHAGMEAAKQELEEHARQVASAEAAVTAVAKILAVKQALATRARYVAKASAKRMQQHLIATTGQDPWERPQKRARQ